MSKWSWLVLVALIVAWFGLGEDYTRERSHPVRKQTESYLRYGVGLAGSAKNSAAELKFLGLGYQASFSEFQRYDFLVWQGEAGAWADNAGGGRSSSGYASFGIGLRVNAGPIVLSSVHGPGLITTPDSYLGSVPQFFHDICAGLQDSTNKASFSFCYKHISNAGIWQPNVGRDLMDVKLAIPL